MSEHGSGGSGAGCGCGCGHARERGGAAAGTPPPWAAAAAAARTFDARPFVAAGAHPVAEVMALLGALRGGEVLQVLTPFVPGPLHERARAVGCEAHSAIDPDGLVRTFFRRTAA